ncbi:SPOR domain-containing protein [Sphingosinicella soli]|uniref:Cell division septation protein DedD n=1 Tax=Sphingosinicella soli TaxID=333708 RepID=A0A7W7B040_9SPHN|nr:SPOR domain-containing protein [Sphingosinicella soli]MBB4630633.1 cell division septation protein DedD [Sphingosinicella soli]
MRHGLILATAFFTLFVSVPTLAGVKEGVVKWQGGDYRGAVVEWMPSAAKGDPDALFNMGQAYKLGRGVPLDKAKAEDFYRRAADKGHAPAQSNLGILLAQRGEKKEAAGLWQKAAAKRDARAQYMLGVLHFNGDTLPKNWPLAYAYMTQANNAGLPQAGRALATMTASLSPGDRASGSEMAQAMMTGDKLGASGKPVAPPRKLANPVAVDKPQAALQKPAPSPGRTTVSNAEIPQPRITASAPATNVAGGGWRIQLGAFSQEARAREAWTGLRRDYPGIVAGLEPVYAPSGSMIRLQAGSFANPGEANSICQRLRDTGRPCFAVHTN